MLTKPFSCPLEEDVYHRCALELNILLGERADEVENPDRSHLPPVTNKCIEKLFTVDENIFS